MIFTFKEIQKINIDKKLELTQKELNSLFQQLQNNSYIPEPVEMVEIKKGSKKRSITISDKKDIIVQRILLEYLTPIFNPTFSDKSYGYRPNKGTLKAINRVSDFIKRGYKYALKTDIKNFFDTIDHSILIKILEKKIDSSLIQLIIAYLKIGSIKLNNYEEHYSGVYQGNIISPILSNIYLDNMDKFLEKHKFDFVRFADDFVVFAKTHKDAQFIYRNLQRFLKIFKLSLNYEKTYITSIEGGFSFLGVFFTDKLRTISTDRIERIKNKILSYSKYPFDTFIDKLNIYYNTISNYYLKISPHNKFIKGAVIDSCIEKVFTSKRERNKKVVVKYVNCRITSASFLTAPEETFNFMLTSF